MRKSWSSAPVKCLPRSRRIWVTIAFGVVPCLPAWGQQFTPGNLVVSRSVYQGTASTVTIGQQLPPVCGASASCTSKATDSGAFPAIGVINPVTLSLQNVWNNTKADGSFGVASPIFLDQITPSGSLINTLAIDPTQIVTSFSSKSELAVNLSTDGSAITFMGYTLGPGNTTSMVNMLDISNSNTPGIVDPTNPVGGANYFRGVAQVNQQGTLTVTDSDAYTGDNSRAAILANGLYYAVGNDNNGSQSPIPASIYESTGAEVIVPGAAPTVPVNMIDPTLVTHAGDKAGKDSNFRGETISPTNTLFVTKGSGSNGIDTVYQVGTTGTLPTVSTAASTVIEVAPGFPTALAKTAGIDNIYPFGIFFANADTMYVADEGDGVIADAPNSPYAGLQKWTFNGSTWSLAYVLQTGLNLGQQYSVPNYPTSLNPAPAGLRNITGRVNADGTVTIWAITATVSTNGDQGADPNQLVTITDSLANTNPSVAAGESFTLLRTANYGEVLRGVSFTPGTIVESAGPVFVTDGSRVEQFSLGGAFVNQFAINAAGRFPNGVGGMAMDSNGDFFITDIGNKNISEFGSNGAFVKSFGSYGAGNGQFLSGIGGVAVDGSGNLWVADAGNYRVQEFSNNGTYLSQFGSVGKGNGQFQSPGAIAIDGRGNIWVTDGTRVQEFSSTGVYESQFAINGAGRFPNGVGGMAIDGSGNFFISDIGNKNISEFNSSGVFVKTFGSYGSSNGQFLSGISGVAIDGSGDVWVSDAGNYRVQEFGNNGVFEQAIGSEGHGNGQFQSPGAIVIMVPPRA